MNSTKATNATSAERMSRVDTAWLRMDTDANLMMIVGVWTLDPPVAYETLCQRVHDRLLKYRRFHQRVVEDPMGASWVTDRHFDIHRHVVRETLQPKKGQTLEAALRERIAELAATPLDPKHPLWQFHVIENLDGSTRVIQRVHHCIGDGIALISVMLSITDGGQAPPQRRPRKGGGEAEPEGDWLADTVLKPLTDLAVKAIGLTGDGVGKSIGLMGMMAQPGGPVGGTLDLARTGYQLLSDAGALALMPDDSPTRLKGTPGTQKRVAWCPPVPLEDVRAIGKALGCSINDVLLACAAGAIGGYLNSLGDDTHGKEIRAMVPVNLRPMSEAWKLGNRFGLVPLVLPIGIDNPVERVYAVRARMAELKGSYQPIMAFGLLAVAGLLVKPVQHAMLNLFAKKATAVMTNVPGPKEPLKFCGSTLSQVMFWVPQSGDIGMGVSILSYGGGVQFGLITDSKLCPDPQAIIDRFAPEFDKLVWLAMMLPWEGQALAA